jgi:3-deoxy-D-manno-octulosonic-acid transferase
MATPFLLLAYQAATAIIEPFMPLVLGGRARGGKEDPARLGERLGRAGAPRPDGALVWLHGVSVGESLSLLPLAETMRRERPDIGLLVTSGTQTSAALLAQRLPPGAIHQYIPVDGPRAVGRFLDHWRPDLAVFVESELWPNLLTATRRRGIRMALVSAKLSEASARGWSYAPAMVRTLLGGFDLLLVQDEGAAERFVSFGVCPDGVADLKFGADPLPADAARLKELRARLADRPVILAASTHPGENEIVLARFHAVQQSPEIADRNPLLVIVPRHPARGASVAGLARDQGLSAGLQSAGAAVGRDPVFIADALGELGLWYRMAGLALIGGSLVEGLAGHNPLEPARLHCPFVSGPHVSNWTTAYGELRLAHATRIIDDAQSIDACFRAAIEGDNTLAAMAGHAQAYVDQKDAEARAAPTLIMGLLP